MATHIARRPIVLMILDGWGERQESFGNAVAAATIPNFHRLWETYPHTTLKASGLAVGLPEGIMGNSEVGHLTLGAGRILFQDLVRIDQAVETGAFHTNWALSELVRDVKKRGGRMHVMGLTSDGGVHSAERHYFAALEALVFMGMEPDQILFHAFLDGRDTPPTSGIDYLRRLEAHLKKLQHGRIATIMGRYWAMDRDKRWERVAYAWNTLVEGEGPLFPDAITAIEDAYASDKHNTDEFVEPRRIVEDGNIRDGDGVLHFNFRADRARQLMSVLHIPNYMPQSGGSGKTRFLWRPLRRPEIDFIGMTQYDDAVDHPVMFNSVHLDNILGEVLAHAGLKQFRVSETEKYAHVTYFFNGGVEKQFDGEDRKLVPSPKVATYDEQPEMSCGEVTDHAVEAIESNQYDFVLMNYPNADMVGHTGSFKAAVAALEALDPQIQRVVEATLKQNGVILMTADHGNCDTMFHESLPEEYREAGVDPEAIPKQFRHTQHSTEQVPLMLIGSEATLSDLQLRSGGLADIAPTVLDLMELDQPSEMTGRSLLARGSHSSITSIYDITPAQRGS